MSWNPFTTLLQGLAGGQQQTPPTAPTATTPQQGAPGFDLNKAIDAMLQFANPQKRMDISGRPESGPIGLDYLERYGPQNEQHRAQSSQRWNALKNEAGWMSPEQKASMSAFNKGPGSRDPANPLELNKQGTAYTPFGTASVRHLQPGDKPTPFTIEGQQGNEWLKQHALAGGNRNALEHIKNLDANRLNLFAQDRGYRPPRETQAPAGPPAPAVTSVPQPTYHPFTKDNESVLPSSKEQPTRPSSPLTLMEQIFGPGAYVEPSLQQQPPRYNPFAGWADAIMNGGSSGGLPVPRTSGEQIAIGRPWLRIAR